MLGLIEKFEYDKELAFLKGFEKQLGGEKELKLDVLTYTVDLPPGTKGERGTLPSDATALKLLQALKPFGVEKTLREDRAQTTVTYRFVSTQHIEFLSKLANLGLKFEGAEKFDTNNLSFPEKRLEKGRATFLALVTGPEAPDNLANHTQGGWLYRSEVKEKGAWPAGFRGNVPATFSIGQEDGETLIQITEGTEGQKGYKVNKFVFDEKQRLAAASGTDIATNITIPSSGGISEKTAEKAIAMIEKAFQEHEKVNPMVWPGMEMNPAKKLQFTKRVRPASSEKPKVKFAEVLTAAMNRRAEFCVPELNGHGMNSKLASETHPDLFSAEVAYVQSQMLKQLGHGDSALERLGGGSKGEYVDAISAEIYKANKGSAPADSAAAVNQASQVVEAVNKVIAAMLPSQEQAK